MNLQEVEARVDELRELGTYWGEARAQWLESCIECGVEDGEQYGDCNLYDLEQRAHFWAMNLYNDCGEEWLALAMDRC